MKKLIILLIIASSIISCEDDFLVKYPTTSMVVENFYKTPADATQAITSIYNIMMRDDFSSSLIMSEAASDNCAGGAGQTDAGNASQLWDRGIQNSDPTSNIYPWRDYWGGIYRANIYLENESSIEWGNQLGLKAQYEAEARFLRAYFHFYLSRLFGALPFVDYPLSPDEVPSRISAEDLYTRIIEDLEFAASNALSAPYVGMNQSNWGHATKWAAESMIANVYLFYSGYYNDATIGEFTAADALGYIEDVITVSGHDLVPEFASLWRVPAISELDTILNYAGEINSEVVFSVRYTNDNPYQCLARMIGPRLTNIDPYGQGWGSIPVLPTLWNAYNPEDKRRSATILSWDDEGYVYDWEGQTQAQYTGYNTKKYMQVSVNGLPEGGGTWQTDIAEDIIVIRFADVLLMGAELNLLSGNAGKATEYVNRVRERAFGDNSQNLGSVSEQDILNERRLELACEGIRYWDVLRSCKGDFSKLANILTYVDETDGGVDYSQTADALSKDVDGNNFVATKGLFQIPQSELDLMGGIIEQNEGYE